MRFPGTFNPGGHNNLITMNYLRNLKAAQKKRAAKKTIDSSANPNPEQVPTKAKSAKSADAPPTPSKPTEEPKAQVEWTDEQDSQLLKMKIEEGAQWKVIATALGRHVGEVKKRWGEIRPKDGSGDNKAEKANIKKQRQHEEAAKEIDELGDVVERFQLEPDDIFDEEECHLLATIIYEEFYVFGHAVSQRFLDITGRRMHPGLIFDKVAGAAVHYNENPFAAPADLI